MRFVSELRPGRLEIASTGYTEPSLVFRAGTSTLLGNPELVAKRVEESCDVVGVVRSQELAAFQAALAEGSSATKLGQERAFNYSSGKWVDLSFWTGRGCERTFSK